MAITRTNEITQLTARRTDAGGVDVEIWYRVVAVDDADGVVMVSEPQVFSPERYLELGPAAQSTVRSKLETALTAILNQFPAP